MPYPTTRTTYKQEQLEKLLPYKVIAEVCGGPLWNQPDRKPRYTAKFASEERDNIRRIIKKATEWSNNGLPEDYSLSAAGLRLWKRLGAFCEELKEPQTSKTLPKENNLDIFGKRGGI